MKALGNGLIHTEGGICMRQLAAVTVLLSTFLLADRVMADVICLFKGEQASGVNKVCFYDCAGTVAAITVAFNQLCPMNVRR